MKSFGKGGWRRLVYLREKREREELERERAAAYARRREIRRMEKEDAASVARDEEECFRWDLAIRLEEAAAESAAKKLAKKLAKEAAAEEARREEERRAKEVAELAAEERRRQRRALKEENRTEVEEELRMKEESVAALTASLSTLPRFVAVEEPYYGGLRPLSPTPFSLPGVLFAFFMNACSLSFAAARPVPPDGVEVSTDTSLWFGIALFVSAVFVNIGVLLFAVAAMLRTSKRAKSVPKWLEDTVDPREVTAAEFRGEKAQLHSTPQNTAKVARERANETEIEQALRMENDRRRKQERRDREREAKRRSAQEADDFLNAVEGPNAASRDVKKFKNALDSETVMETCMARVPARNRTWYVLGRELNFGLIHPSQVCAGEQGFGFLQFGKKDVEEGRELPCGLLDPLRDRFKARSKAAMRLAEGSVERNAQFGRLTGLNVNGCMEGACAVCKDCYKSLDKGKIPKRALMNDTWQGLIPPELQMKTDEFPGGLNMVELSMVCIYCPLTYVTLLKGERSIMNQIYPHYSTHII